MEKNQQQILLLILLIAIFYCIYLAYNQRPVSKVEGLLNINYPSQPQLSKARSLISYTALTPLQNNLQVPPTLMSGEVYRYSNKDFVSYDIYGYLHLINGAVFEKKRDEKYKIYIGDNNGKMIVEKELIRDGDDVYKLKIRDLPITNSHLFNQVIITFVDQDQKESIVLQGNLVKQD
jgi:hypothetical protein